MALVLVVVLVTGWWYLRSLDEESFFVAMCFIFFAAGWYVRGRLDKQTRPPVTLYQLALQLLNDTGDQPPSVLEDSLSICQYLSKHENIELTIDEGAEVRRLIKMLKYGDSQ